IDEAGNAREIPAHDSQRRVELRYLFGAQNHALVGIAPAAIPVLALGRTARGRVAGVGVRRKRLTFPARHLALFECVHAVLLPLIRNGIVCRTLGCACPGVGVGAAPGCFRLARRKASSSLYACAAICSGVSISASLFLGGLFSAQPRAALV